MVRAHSRAVLSSRGSMQEGIADAYCGSRSNVPALDKTAPLEAFVQHLELKATPAIRVRDRASCRSIMMLTPLWAGLNPSDTAPLPSCDCRAECKEHEMTTSSIVPQTDEEQTHSTMMAWRVHEFGPTKGHELRTSSSAQAWHCEILVKVEGAGVGPWDGWIRAGKSALPQPLPLILGSDLSGEIVATGPGVSELG